MQPTSQVYNIEPVLQKAAGGTIYFVDVLQKALCPRELVVRETHHVLQDGFRVVWTPVPSRRGAYRVILGEHLEACPLGVITDPWKPLYIIDIVHCSKSVNRVGALSDILRGYVARYYSIFFLPTRPLIIGNDVCDCRIYVSAPTPPSRHS